LHHLEGDRKCTNESDTPRFLDVVGSQKGIASRSARDGGDTQVAQATAAQKYGALKGGYSSVGERGIAI